MAVMLAAFGILALYVETILQFYVILSSHSQLTNNLVAMTSLVMTLLTFLVTSIMSAVLILAGCDFQNKKGVKRIFGILHILNLGYLWRIFKLILSFSESELKQLVLMRLVHVVFQSSPYVILYTMLFVRAQNVSVIQILSLLTSIVSSALTITTYNLQKKLNTDPSTNKLSDVTTNSRGYTGIVMTIVGTILVVSSRVLSISFMAAQTGGWVAVPLCLHFILMLVVSLVSSKRQHLHPALCSGRTTCAFYHVGVSIINCIDLAAAGINRIMCSYVGFYSLILVENIIYLSFWLLGSDVLYLKRLIIVIGILTCFIIGLIAKFVGCSLFQELHTAPSNDITSLSTVNTISTSITTNHLNLSSDSTTRTSTDDADLICIIQATVQAHRARKLALAHASRSETSTERTMSTVCATSSNQLSDHTNVYTLTSSDLHTSHCPFHETIRAYAIDSNHFSHQSTHQSTQSSKERSERSQESSSFTRVTTPESGQFSDFHTQLNHYRTHSYSQALGNSSNNTTLTSDMFYDATLIPEVLSKHSVEEIIKDPHLVQRIHKHAPNSKGSISTNTTSTMKENPEDNTQHILQLSSPTHSNIRQNKRTLTRKRYRKQSDNNHVVRSVSERFLRKPAITSINPHIYLSTTANVDSLVNAQKTTDTMKQRTKTDKVIVNQNFKCDAVIMPKRTDDVQSTSDSTVSRTFIRRTKSDRDRIKTKSNIIHYTNIKTTPQWKDTHTSSSTTFSQNTTCTGSSMTSQTESSESWSDSLESTVTWPFSENRLERKTRLPDEHSKLSTSENVMRWLADVTTGVTTGVTTSDIE